LERFTLKMLVALVPYPFSAMIVKGVVAVCEGVAGGGEGEIAIGLRGHTIHGDARGEGRCCAGNC